MKNSPKYLLMCTLRNGRLSGERASGASSGIPRERIASRRHSEGNCRRARRKSSVDDPSMASRPRPWIQQLPTPSAEAIRCMFAMATLQSSIQTSDNSSLATTTIAASAPASMREEPRSLQPDISISFCLSRTTMSCQGRTPLPDAEDSPAMMIWLSFSIGIGSPV